jgi:hypothetical protein
MDDSKKKCATCMRKISSANIHHLGEKEYLRDGKLWCGGCELNVKYISYPETVEYYDNTNIIFKKRNETVPSSPPWTTWSGVILCNEDSDIGKIIKKNDPNAEEGYLIVDKKRIPVPGKIRGIWTSSDVVV